MDHARSLSDRMANISAVIFVVTEVSALAKGILCDDIRGEHGKDIDQAHDWPILVCPRKALHQFSHLLFGHRKQFLDGFLGEIAFRLSRR